MAQVNERIDVRYAPLDKAPNSIGRRIKFVGVPGDPAKLKASTNRLPLEINRPLYGLIEELIGLERCRVIPDYNCGEAKNLFLVHESSGNKSLVN